MISQLKMCVLITFSLQKCNHSVYLCWHNSLYSCFFYIFHPYIQNGIIITCLLPECIRIGMSIVIHLMNSAIE